MIQVAQGGTATLSAIYRDGLGNLADPVDPAVDILDPFAVERVTNATPTRSSLGVFTYAYELTEGAQLGVWTAHWTGTIDGLPAGGDEYFSVVPAGSISGPASYATLEALKGYLNIQDGEDDAVLQMALDAATEQINAYCGRGFGIDPIPTLRYYRAEPGSTNAVDVGAISTVTDLEVATDDGSGTWTVWVLDVDYRLAPYNAEVDGRPWTRLVAIGSKRFPTRERGVRVTARGGWAQVPAAVRQATLIQASRLAIRRHSPYGVAGSPEFGSELRLLSRLDPDVEALLRPYRANWWVV